MKSNTITKLLLIAMLCAMALHFSCKKDDDKPGYDYSNLSGIMAYSISEGRIVILDGDKKTHKTISVPNTITYNNYQKALVWEASVSLSLDGKQMVYAALANEGYRIFKMTLNTGEYLKFPGPASTNTGHLTCPVWNSDNSRIYFLDAGLIIHGPVYSINPDGNDLIQVTDFPVFRRISVAGDESFIVYASVYQSFDDPPQGIYLYNIQEDIVTPLITYDYPLFSYSPVLSPDEKQVAFVLMNFAEISVPPYYRRIMIINTDGSDARMVIELPMARNVMNTYVTWSPDGTRLAFNFAGGMEGDDYPQIYIINTDGTNMTQVTFGSEYVNGPSWIK